MKSINHVAFYHPSNYFRNVYKLFHTTEISKAEMLEHFGKIDYEYQNHINRPRYFKAEYKDKLRRYNNAEIYYVQPNRYKNDFILVRNHFIVNPSGKMFYSGKLGNSGIILDPWTIVIKD